MVKNKVHALIDKYGFDDKFSDLFGKLGVKWLKKLEIGLPDKRFVVVEGDEDETFLKNLFQKYNRNFEEIGYLAKAGSKDLVKQVSVH